MTVTINGSGTVTGIAAGGLPDAIITQPEMAAGVAGTGPAFSAYAGGATALGSGVYTKVLFNTTEWNPGGGYDSANSRFTPQVAGYYRISATIWSEVLGASASGLTPVIYLNGSQAKRGSRNYFPSATYAGGMVTALIYLNGSTDYVEIYATQGSGSSVNTQTGGTLTSWCGELVRAA